MKRHQISEDAHASSIYLPGNGFLVLGSRIGTRKGWMPRFLSFEMSWAITIAWSAVRPKPPDHHFEAVRVGECMMNSLVEASYVAVVLFITLTISRSLCLHCKTHSSPWTFDPWPNSVCALTQMRKTELLVLRNGTLLTTDYLKLLRGFQKQLLLFICRLRS